MIKVAPCILSATPFPPESPLSCQGRSEEIYVISVHLRVLRPLRHPPHLSPEVLLAASGEGQRSNSFRAFLNPSSLCLPIRIRTSCWCTTSTCPTPTTTSSSSPAASPSGARRRSGPRRSSSRSSSPCVSSCRRSIWRGGQWEGKGGGSGESPMYPEVQNCLLLKRHDSRNLKQRNEQGRGISLPFASILETRGGNFAREERLMKRATGRSLPQLTGCLCWLYWGWGIGSWVTQSSDLDAKRQK